MFYFVVKRISMQEGKERKCKNLVYLMIRRYGDNWKQSFPEDMGLPADKCQEIYDMYYDEVMDEISKEEPVNDVPTADELIEKGMKKLRNIISTCDDPSKLTRSIEILADMRDSGAVKREEHKTIFDRIQEKAKKNEDK